MPSGSVDFLSQVMLLFVLSVVWYTVSVVSSLLLEISTSVSVSIHEVVWTFVNGKTDDKLQNDPNI